MTLSWVFPSSFVSCPRYCGVLLLLVCSLAFSAAAQTTNPAYLADMPSIDRVKAQIQGKDPTDTAARQVAVFAYLQEYIKRIAYNKIPAQTSQPTSSASTLPTGLPVTRS